MIRHLIDISDLTQKEIKKILLFAKKIKNKPLKYNDLLENKYLGMIFSAQSARTRLSFDIGMKKLGGNTIEMNQEAIGFGSRESDSDIMNTLSQYIDCLIIRNNNHKKIKLLASVNVLPIINGLSDSSHPCQILSDIFTIEENIGAIERKTICWIGDINNVLKSLVEASRILNFSLNISSPKEVLKKHKFYIKKNSSKKIIFFENPLDAANMCDCIMTDVWFSMGEKKSNYKKNLFKNFQVNDKLMNCAKSKAIFMHCLPANRNQEVTDSVIDGKKSVVWNQTLNRMFVQQSILYFLMK